VFKFSETTSLDIHSFLTFLEFKIDLANEENKHIQKKMNSLLTTLTYLKALELDTRVTTVIEGEGEEIDTHKTNQYPLVNLSIGTSSVDVGWLNTNLLYTRTYAKKFY
jgi:hypothetical protein